MTEGADAMPVPASDQISLLHRTLAGLCRSDVPLGRALRVLESDLGSAKLKETVRALAADIEAGTPLAEAYKRHQGVFPPLYGVIVEAGMASADLPGAFEEIARHAELRADLGSKLRGLLTYPIIAMCCILAVAAFLLVVVVPGFEQIFASLNVELPLPTRMLLMLGDTPAMGAGLLCALGVFVVIVGLSWSRDPLLERGFLGGLLGSMPVLGSMRWQAGSTTACATLALLLRRSLPLDRALQLAAASAGQPRLRAELQTASEAVAGGEPLLEALTNKQLLPPSLLWLLGAAERSGTLEDAFDDVSRLQQAALQRKVERVRTLLGPALEICLGLMVAFFGLALFVPLFQLIGKLA